MTQANPSMGTIVSWKSPKEVPFLVLKNALSASGFDDKLAREMLTRNAFSRAAKALSEHRIIKKTEEDDENITFQFTKEWLEQKEYKFKKECVMTVHKELGNVWCADLDPDLQDLAKVAQKLLYEHQAKRNTSDISRMIMKIFEEQKGDLIPIREQGGVYFVPASHDDLVKNIRNLMGEIGGAVSTFSIRFGESDTEGSVAEAMTAHLSDLITQFRATCTEINTDSADWMVDRRQKSLKELRSKLECYKGLLGGYAESIGDQIQEADKELMAKIEKSMSGDGTGEEAGDENSETGTQVLEETAV